VDEVQCEVVVLQEAENKGDRKVFLFSEAQIDFYWADVSTLLSQCPGYYDFYTPEWTYQRAKAGDLQVWGCTDGNIRAIVLTQILCFPAQKVFEIIGAAGIGLLDFFDELEEVFEFIAADAGCGMMTARVRPGIERMLQRRQKGALRHAVFIYKPVGKRSEH
jgi:hypothetical protein